MKTRVLYVVAKFGARSQTFVSDLLTHLDSVPSVHLTVACNERQDSGIEQPPFELVVTAHDRFNARMGKAGRRVAQLFGRGAIVRFAHRHQRRSSRRFARHLTQVRPDVVYCEFGTAATPILPGVRAAGLSIVVHFHGADASTMMARPWYKRQILEVFQYASRLVVASDHVRRLLILAGAPRDRIEVVRLGVSVGDFKPLEWSERRKSAPSVFFGGRLTPKKNPVALVEAFHLVRQEIPDATLTIVGKGEEHDRTSARVRDLGLTDSVQLVGPLPHNELLGLMRNHWIYAQHSVTPENGDQEGFAISPAEAALLELPVVATLHDGIPEHVIDGETGFLVREYDFETMAERIIALIRDPTLAERMGRAGRANVQALCDPRERASRIAAILQKVGSVENG